MKRNRRILFLIPMVCLLAVDAAGCGKGDAGVLDKYIETSD